jgi:hypothetical protein
MSYLNLDGAGPHPVIFPCLTTAERDALLTLENGFTIFNTDELQLELWINGSWLPV